MSTFSRIGALAMVTCAAFVACGGSSTSSPSVSAIAISPSPCTVGRTDSRKLSALATMPDGTKKDITTDPAATWHSANTNTATVNSDGTVVGVNAGVTAITVGYQGASGTLDCTVGP